MRSRHELRLIGITYNQIESGVYALILEEVDGRRRIPIIIGYPEAQSIECKLQEIVTPRPLTHDLMREILDEFSINLVCVEIYKLPNGVFAANLIMEAPDQSLRKIDARSSDAIAIAIRTNSPIYTSSEVLDEAGFYPADEGKRADKDDDLSGDAVTGADTDESGNSRHGSQTGIQDDDTMSKYTDRELEDMIEKYASDEKYEEAARLRRILLARRNAEK